MRVISGLIRPTSGSLVMEGVDLAATRRIGSWSSASLTFPRAGGCSRA